MRQTTYPNILNPSTWVKYPCSLCSYKPAKRQVFNSHQVPKSRAVSIYINCIKKDLWAFKEFPHVTHKVILIAISPFIRNS